MVLEPVLEVSGVPEERAEVGWPVMVVAAVVVEMVILPDRAAMARGHRLVLEA